MALGKQKSDKQEEISLTCPGWKWVEGRGWHRPWKLMDGKITFACHTCEDVGRLTVMPYGYHKSNCESMYDDRWDHIPFAVACCFCENPFKKIMTIFIPGEMKRIL